MTPIAFQEKVTFTKYRILILHSDKIRLLEYRNLVIKAPCRLLGSPAIICNHADVHEFVKLRYNGQKIQGEGGR